MTHRKVNVKENWNTKVSFIVVEKVFETLFFRPFLLLDRVKLGIRVGTYLVPLVPIPIRTRFTGSNLGRGKYDERYYSSKISLHHPFEQPGVHKKDRKRKVREKGRRKLS